MLAHFPPHLFYKDLAHSVIETGGVIEIGVAVDSDSNKSKEQVGELVKEPAVITPKTYYLLQVEG